MDFLRIRQKARERAREREAAARAPADEAEAVATPPAVPAPPRNVAAPERDPSPPSAQPGTTAPSSPSSSPEPVAVSPQPAPDPSPLAEEPGLDPAALDDLAQLEHALRAELNVVGESARAGAPATDDEPDPLDDFFWRADEAAPRLPDLVAASELPAPEPPPVRREWLTFRLGQEDYALEIEHVREVLKPPPLTEVPRAPEHILGVIMVRGEVVAVVDPRARLKLPRTAPGPRARVLVCDTGEVSCGVLVDSVSSVIRLAPAAIEPRPTGVGVDSAEYIAGIGRERNRLYILLDAPALLGDAAALRPAGTA